ncbi:MAG: hypothetical protein LBP26_04255 [Clostridiales bacterium]|nr:hypothetical protein [Clostridiales bacterium]
MKQLRNFNKGADAQGLKDNPAVADALKKYDGMGEDELISRLLESVRTARADGTYNPSQMSAYVDMLRPHLSAVQYEKLRNVITLINGEDV